MLLNTIHNLNLIRSYTKLKTKARFECIKISYLARSKPILSSSQKTAIKWTKKRIRKTEAENGGDGRKRDRLKVRVSEGERKIEWEGECEREWKREEKFKRRFAEPFPVQSTKKRGKFLSSKDFIRFGTKFCSTS